MTIAALVASGPMRMGATGPAVTAVQLAWRSAGYDLEADGGLGTITQIALKAFDASRGLAPDGNRCRPLAARWAQPGRPLRPGQRLSRRRS
jgi:peptidoglycan hydrolase-like protein with peptidoglycan-binding domain